jgi:hypothetical protein
MPIGRIGNSLTRRVQALEDNAASGYIRVMVRGTSTGWGGTNPPVYVPTTFLVRFAVANLAKEYDLRDATEIYNFGDDVFAGEMKVSIPGVGVGFYVDYRQLDPNEPWELTFNWYARG